MNTITVLKRSLQVFENLHIMVDLQSGLREAIAREEALASLKACSREMDKINNHLDAVIDDCDKQRGSQATSHVKPDAWKIPCLQTFKNAERVHFSRAPGCILSDAELMALMEGTVMWTVSLWCDGLSVTDRDGVVHEPRPLFECAPGEDRNEWKEAMMQGLCDAAIDAPTDMAPLDILNRIIDMRVTMAKDPAIHQPGGERETMVLGLRLSARLLENGQGDDWKPELIADLRTAADMLEAMQEGDANAPWLSTAHMICTDAGIAQGHIRWRMDALRDKLSAALPPSYPEELSEFKEGQWWVNELDQMRPTATDDQKRAIAVVHHLLRSVRRAMEVKSPVDCAD